MAQKERGAWNAELVVSIILYKLKTSQDYSKGYVVAVGLQMKFTIRIKK